MLYTFDGKVYLVNEKGKLQKSESKDYALDNANGDEYRFTIGKNSYEVSAAYKVNDEGKAGDDNVLDTLKATIPEIYLYDGVIGLGQDKNNKATYKGTHVYSTVNEYTDLYGKNAKVSLADDSTDDAE